MQTIRIASILVLATACGPASTALREPDQYDSATKTGCGSDENWRTFDDKELTNSVITDDAQATAFLAPIVDGASFPASMKPTFTWQPSTTIPGKMPSGDATCTECPSCGALVPDHLPPVSGDAYDMQFSVGGKVVWRIIYTSQQWSPPDALWSSWRGQTVSLRAYRIVFKVNDPQGGPFTSSKPLTFSVGS